MLGREAFFQCTVILIGHHSSYGSTIASATDRAVNRDDPFKSRIFDEMA